MACCTCALLVWTINTRVSDKVRAIAKYIVKSTYPYCMLLISVSAAYLSLCAIDSYEKNYP